MRTSGDRPVIIRAIAPRTDLVDQLAAHRRFRYALAVNLSGALHLRRNHAWHRAPSRDLYLQPQLVARAYWTPEAGPLDSGEHHQLVAPVFHFSEQQRATGLRDGLNDQHTRHDRQAGKMPGKKR